jgi:hypothetical protein
MKPVVALSSALVLALTASVARAQSAEEGYEHHPTASAPTPTDGFLGRRSLMKDLSTADQAALAKLILAYTSANNGAIVKQHEATMMDPKLHDVHQAPYTQLFSWHRTYLGGLEAWLTQQGQAKFVPLPKWIPSDPIPLAFGCDANGKKLIKNFNPNQDWTQFYHSKLPAFIEEIRQGPTDTTANSLILADTLVVPHNNTHNIIGGTMATMRSPAVPIFWCYHAFIDDIAWDWEHSPHNAPKLMTAGEKPGVTTIQARVEKNGADVVLHSAAGDFTVANEPFKTILADQDGKDVFVQASLFAGKATVESVTANNGMTAASVKDAHGRRIATVGEMGEVRITGQRGDTFEVEAAGKKGFLSKSDATVGTTPTPGVTGSIPH